MQKQISKNRSLSVIFFLGATLALTLLLIVGHPVPVAAQTTISCANTAAIPNPESASLIRDCETLLGLKDTLRGSASLNWSTSRPIGQWQGITVSSSRVTELDLGDKGLTGSLPATLASLSNLQTLHLKGNQFSGCIPAALRAVATNDLAQLRLLFCGQTSGSAADEETEPVAGESPTILYLPIIQK